MLVGRLLGAGLLGFGLGKLASRVGFAPATVRGLDHQTRLFNDCFGLRDHIVRITCDFHAPGGCDQLIGPRHRLVAKRHRQLHLLHGGCVRGLLHQLQGGLGRGLRLPGVCGRNLGGFQCAHVVFGILVPVDLLGHFPRCFGLRLGSRVDLVLGQAQRIARNLIEFLLHVRVGGELFLQILEKILGALLRHLGQHFGVGILFVEILLDACLILCLAQRGTRLVRLFTLLQRLVVTGYQVERVHGFLFLHHGTLQIHLLLQRLLALGRI